jgi:hypothetical protein
MSCARRASTLALATVAVLLLGSGCGKVQVPKSFDTFNAKDGTVKLKRPASWEQERGTAKKFRSVAFESGAARIRVLADVKGSLIGDIAGGGQAGAAFRESLPDDVAEEISPVAQVHEEMSLPQLEEEFNELDVKSTETIQTGFGETRLSEFAGSGTLGGTTHGYLATALGHDKRVRVICMCPEKYWETLKSAFDEVIESMGPGQRE